MSEFRQFAALVKEAYGCQFPDVLTMFLADQKTVIIYDAVLPDWGIQFAVPLSAETALGFLALESDEPITHDRLRTLKLRPIDAITYALASFEIQSEAVQRHLVGRFHGYMKDVRTMAKARWRRMDRVL